MIKILMGEKGTGKTKAFIDMVNQSINEEKGNVICVMKGDRHLFDLKSAIRLTDTTDFYIEDYHALHGFISGMISRDYDITHIFIDSITKIAGESFDEFDGLTVLGLLGQQFLPVPPLFLQTLLLFFPVTCACCSTRR